MFMKVACLIPARFNSTRFPGKLLAMAKKKTVLQRTIESALDHFPVYVATDDERIAKHAEEVGAKAIWTLPTHINGSSRIAEAVSKAEINAEIILNLQGDHPCMQAQSMKAAVQLLIDDPTLPMSTIATPIRSLEDFLAPHIVKVILNKKGEALYFSRSPIPHSKTLPKIALQHIGLYAFRREFLFQYPKLEKTALQMQEDLEQLPVLEMGYRIKVAVVEEKCIGVDIPTDLEKLTNYLEAEPSS